MYCTKCGKQLEDCSVFCNHCGERVRTVRSAQPVQPGQEQRQPVSAGALPVTRRLPRGMGIVFGFVIMLLIIGISRCSGNKDKNHESDRDFSSYSSSSSSSYSSSNSVSPYTYAMLYLKESNVKITHNSSYTVCTGTIKNTGTSTVRFVKIKGAFTDYSGNVADTDWTYAVGNEGLAPGESTTFRMSIPKNSSVKTCKITFISD